MGHVTYEILKERRRELESHPTPQEVKFRYRLAGGRIKFQFQVIIPPYIVDFLIPKRHLIIELDGSHHLTPERLAYDKRRDEYLARRGFVVVRIPNDQVAAWPLKNIRKYPKTKGCVNAIQDLLDEFNSQNGKIFPTKRKAKSRIVRAQLKSRPKKVKCSACGGWCMLFHGRLGPHRLRGDGRPCANKIL